MSSSRRPAIELDPETGEVMAVDVRQLVLELAELRRRERYARAAVEAWRCACRVLHADRVVEMMSGPLDRLDELFPLVPVGGADPGVSAEDGFTGR